jgi:hypothetical protein
MKTTIPTAPGRFDFHDSPKSVRGEFFVCGKLFHAEIIGKDDADFPGTLAEFQTRFIRQVQDLVLGHAASSGKVISPTNHVEQFWTRDFILRFGNTLRRPRKRAPFTGLFDLGLRAAWHQYGLCDMTRDKLADWLNKNFNLNPKISPAAARKRAQRLDLFSTTETQGGKTN